MDYLRNHKEITIVNTTYSVEKLLDRYRKTEVYLLRGKRGGEYRLYVYGRTYSLLNKAMKPVAAGLWSNVIQAEENEIRLPLAEYHLGEVIKYLTRNCYELAGIHVAKWEKETGERLKAEMIPSELGWKLAAVIMTQSYQGLKRLGA